MFYVMQPMEMPMTTMPPNDPIVYQAWLEESLTPPEAAEFLKVEEHWLQLRRISGDGPRFRRLSPKQIVYVRRDLIEFRDGKTYMSTSEYTPQRLPADDGTGTSMAAGDGEIES